MVKWPSNFAIHSLFHCLAKLVMLEHSLKGNCYPSPQVTVLQIPYRASLPLKNTAIDHKPFCFQKMR